MNGFEWKEKANTVSGRRQNIEDGNKKLYLLFTEQCKLSLKNKLKVTKGYNNSHNIKQVVKRLDLIRNAVFGVGEHLKWPWAMKKSYKFLYSFFQRSNSRNNDYMK